MTTHPRSQCHARPLPPTRPPTARDLMRESEVLIPLGMSVGAAAGLLDAVGGMVAPVVDSRGRCVGVFTAADYRRWSDRVASDAEPITVDLAVPGAPSANEVRYHITGRFAATTADTGVQDLLRRLDAA